MEDQDTEAQEATICCIPIKKLLVCLFFPYFGCFDRHTPGTATRPDQPGNEYELQEGQEGRRGKVLLLNDVDRSGSVAGGSHGAGS